MIHVANCKLPILIARFTIVCIDKKPYFNKVSIIIIIIIANADEIADGLNKYFNDIGTVLADNLPSGQNSFEAYVSHIETSFEIQNISVVVVKSEISRIKTSKATGHNRISPKLLKDSV